MELMPITYTIGVKRRWFWFYRRYRVVGHRNEELCGSCRLVLTLPSGSVIVIPEITKKFVKVFPDYISAERNLKKLKEEKQHAEVRV